MLISFIMYTTLTFKESPTVAPVTKQRQVVHSMQISQGKEGLMVLGYKEL